MLTILAQLEIERTSERTKFGMIGAVKKGHFVGRAPIGYDKQDKKLVIKDIESEVIRRIFDYYIKGMAANAITKLLNKENNLLQIIPNKKDNRFDEETLTLLTINT